MSRSPEAGAVHAPEAEDALRVAFEEHYAPLLRLSILLSGDRQAAEDVVQEAFVRSSGHLGDVPVERLRSYLRQVVVNLWRDRRRWLARDRSARDRSLSVGRAGSVDPADAVALRTAVMRLPSRQRACVVLRYYEDLPEREVAALLNCSVGTVKSHSSRAIAHLRREFGDED
ncbi:MAG: sigma-70 family RNA polymerase sigma factor [Actinomycetota bacterium]